MTYDRQRYLETLRNNLEPNVFNHSLALEACMEGLYDYFQSQALLDSTEPTKDEWLLAGFLHDVDYGGEFKDQHPAKTQEALDKYGLEVPDTVMHIIKAHAPKHTNTELQSKADWSIFCADTLTGLITAVALIMPSKKIADVKLSSVIKRFIKEPKFAAGTRRDEVATCSDPEGLNLPVEKFIEVCLDSMKSIAGEIGL